MPGCTFTVHPFFTLVSDIPTEGSGNPIHKGSTWPKQGEKAAEIYGDHVVYHPKQESFEKGKETVNLCWDITLGLSPAILLVTWPISGTACADFHVHATKC